MSFQEFVNSVYEGAVDLYDLSEEDMDRLWMEYESARESGEA